MNIYYETKGIAEILGGWMVWAAIRGNSNNKEEINQITNSDNHTVPANESTNLTIPATTITTATNHLLAKSIKKPWWYALLGSALLVTYGFLPTLQPTDSFGRIYAVYGGFFIVMSFLIGWALDGDRPDLGDVCGGIISLAGVMVIMFWPR